MRFLDRIIVIAIAIYVGSLAIGKWQSEQVEIPRRTTPPPAQLAPAPRATPTPVPGPAQGPAPGVPLAPRQAGDVEIERQERQLDDLGRGRVNIIETNDRRRGQLSSGTAWSAGNDVWTSARHVVEGCDRLMFEGATWRPVTTLNSHPDADVAAIKAGFARDFIPLAARAPQPGDYAFGVGYPQRQAGVIILRLRGSERVKLSGRIDSQKPFRAYVWQVERYPRIRGEPERVGGLSGGPIIDRSAQAVGVAIFEAPRRHALGSVSLSDLRRTVGPTAEREPRARLEPRDFDAAGRQLLERGTVMQVLCR